MGRKRYFIRGEAVWEGLHLQELWEQEVAVLTPLAIRCLACSLQQAPDSAADSVSMVPQFRCENHSKSSALPHFPPAVRVFCHWFLWDHWLVEL